MFYGRVTFYYSVIFRRSWWDIFQDQNQPTIQKIKINHETFDQGGIFRWPIFTFSQLATLKFFINNYLIKTFIFVVTLFDEQGLLLSISIGLLIFAELFSFKKTFKKSNDTPYKKIKIKFLSRSGHPLKKSR